MAGRIRSIKPELLDDEIAAGLSDSAWRLFVSSWLLADDQGSFRAAPRYLAAQVWQDTSRDALTPLLELAEKERVLLYEVDGQLYANVPTWERHQRVDNAGKPRVPVAPTNIREVSRNLAASLRGSPLLPQSPRLDLRPPTTDHRNRNVVSNPLPSGPGLLSDLGPQPSVEPSLPTFRPTAPSDPTTRSPIPGPWAGPETHDDPSRDPDADPEPSEPVNAKPEPPPATKPDEPASDAAAMAPSPARSDPAKPLVQFSLTAFAAKRDPVADIFAEYVAAWKRVIGGRRPPRLDEKRRRLTNARLREFTEEDLKAAARGVFACKWNVDEKRTDYDLVMRDAAHVEKFAQLGEQEAPAPPSRQPPAPPPPKPIRVFDAEALLKLNAQKTAEALRAEET